jgi:hypothetical protein
MRRARNKQHAQVLANALDQRDRVIVGGGDLAVELIDGELDDVFAAPWQIEIERVISSPATAVSVAISSPLTRTVTFTGPPGDAAPSSLTR